MNYSAPHAENLASDADFDARVDEVVRFLRHRCGTVLARDTVAGLLSGSFGHQCLTDQGIAAWARAEAGSYGRPTFSQVEGVTATPRILLLGEAQAQAFPAPARYVGLVGHRRRDLASRAQPGNNAARA